MFKKIISSLALAGIFVVSPSIAASYPDTYFGLPEETTSGFYLGLQGGFGVVNVAKGSVVLFPANAVIPGIGFIPAGSGVFTPAEHARNAAGRIDFGYYFNPYFGVEVGGSAWDSSNVTWTENVTQVILGQNFSLKGTRNDYAVDLLAKVDVPVYQKLHAFAKGGVAYVMDQVRLSTRIPNIGGSNQVLVNLANAVKHQLNTNEHRFTPELAAGIGYQYDENWDFSLNYSYIFGHGGNALSNSIPNGNNSNSNTFTPKLSMLTLAVEWDM